MPAFLFAFLAVLLAGAGARDQLTLAALGPRQGARPAVLLVALGCTAATAALAASAAIAAQTLPAGVRTTILVLAIALAGIELLFASTALPLPREPTNSLAALAVVLIARQLTDAARLLVFAIAAATQAPWAAGAGGATGGMAAMTLGWTLGEVLHRREIAWLRRALGLAALAGAALFGFA